ncbi:MAG: hypothetical protein ACKVT2_12225 [Saprospiraceae bacterium]
MKNKFFLFLLPMLAAVWLTSCHKDSTPPYTGPPLIDYTVLPPATQEGKNTFGCLVNGEVWVPRVELFVPWYDLAASFSEKDGSGVGNITCRLLTKDQDDFMQVIFGPTFLHTGLYYMKPLASTDAQMRIGASPWYGTDDGDSTENWVRLNLIDTSRNIVAGTFQFTLYNSENKNDKVVLSEGRFDLLYYPQ